MLVLQVFLFKDGQFLGNEMATGERIEIGRDPSCDLVLDDENVSRRHAFLFEHEGQLAVQDGGSNLGTRVNGESCATPRFIGARDDVAIGRYTLKFKRMESSAPSAVAPSFDEVPATAHIGSTSAAEPTAISTPGSLSPPAANAPPAAGASPEAKPPAAALQFPTGLAPGGDDDATMIDPSPLGGDLNRALIGGLPGTPDDALDSALDEAFPSEGKPTAVNRLPRGALDTLGATLEQHPGQDLQSSAPAPVTAASQPDGAPVEAGFESIGATALPPPTPGAAPGSVPVSTDLPATQMRDVMAKAQTMVSADRSPASSAASASAPSGAAPPAVAFDPQSAASISAPSTGSSPLVAMPGTGDADELEALLEGTEGMEIPSVEWDPAGGLVDDDEDEDEDPLPEWSIVEALVSAQQQPGQAKDDATLVEVIHYRNDRIIDHAELKEGERFDFGRIWTKEGQQDEGIGKSRALVKHKRGGIAELIVNADISGMLLREGQQIDLRSVPEASGKKGKVPLTLGDFASLEVFGDRVFVRIGKAPAVKPTAEMVEQTKRERKLNLIALGIALGTFSMIFALAWIAQYRALAETVIQLEDDGFAEIIEPELELEEPEPEPEEPKIEEEIPQPEKKEAPKPDPKPQAKPDAPKKPGVLDALKNVPKQRAGNQSLSAAMSNIKGVRVPGASGFKVSSVVGKGPKGVSIGGASGGVSSKSLNSILRKGGGAGNLASKKGRRVKGRVKTLKRMSKIKGRGQLTKNEIMKVINANIGKIQYCYEKQLRIQPGLSGKVALEWVIGKDGRVKSVKSSGSTLRNSAAINCITRQVKKWKFPKPRGNGTVIVKFPFVFNTL